MRASALPTHEDGTATGWERLAHARKAILSGSYAIHGFGLTAGVQHRERHYSGRSLFYAHPVPVSPRAAADSTTIT